MFSINLSQFSFPFPTTPHCKDSEEKKNKESNNSKPSCLPKPKAFTFTVTGMAMDLHSHMVVSVLPRARQAVRRFGTLSGTR